MSDFWNYIKGLFRTAADSSSQKPLIHELIQRSEEEIQAYEQWKKSLVCHRLLDWIKSQYHLSLSKPAETDDAIDFLRTPSAKGFVIYFRRMQYNSIEIQHFFDLLKEKTLAIGYRSYVSDTKTYNKGKWVENVQRHYLKPPGILRLPKQKPMDQHYGNINIELLIRNNEVWNLKFSATGYQDRMYQKAADFGELIQKL